MGTVQSKFNVNKDKEKRTYHGITFDSRMEMKYYCAVVCPKVESILPITYVADFYIEYADGHSEVIDVKGCPDIVATIKRKMFWYRYPLIEYNWVTYVKKYGGWLDYDKVKRLRKEEKRNAKNRLEKSYE